MTMTLKEFLESPPETRGHILVVRIPPRKRLVIVPVKKPENKEK